MAKINVQLQRQLQELKEQYAQGELTQQQYKRACIRAVKEAPEEHLPSNAYDAMESARLLKDGTDSGDYDVLGSSSGLRCGGPLTQHTYQTHQSQCRHPQEHLQRPHHQ